MADVDVEFKRPSDGGVVLDTPERHVIDFVYQKIKQFFLSVALDHIPIYNHKKQKKLLSHDKSFYILYYIFLLTITTQTSATQSDQASILCVQRNKLR